MRYVIDRIVEGIAVCECLDDETTIELTRKQLPKGAREGDVMVRDGDSFTLDRAATKQRRADLQVRLSKLFVD